MTSFQRIGNTALLNASANIAYTQVYATNKTFLVTNDSANIAFFNITSNAAVPLVNTLTTLLANTATGNANTSVTTVTYAAQASAPFDIGSIVQLTGFTPSAYNGNLTVLTCSNTTVTVSSTASGNVTVLGNVSQPILNGTSSTPILGGQTLVYTATTALASPAVISISAITASGNATLYFTPGRAS
jgi:hypothetical protein